ncbi:long-chain-fatty-acid--CoA ligase [Actinobacillus pleuropneumoniae serovar 11 str. 56153]|nr:long-chain-fatty-acid--CoA ligase [Actinobacillus pleuropneumoniae serovar 9 str. CVJ13261]EFM98029.1 long-chain-fatty-acid--CoA ligase [Actinobacillus pleuropneumoniae serovar 11 str. 56153]UKH31281.1 hypothetical protein D1104_08060 [Actinobacillus pleuropneumoniae serovar 11 str. 56153]UKH35424.1 hypothetical protein D1102_08030 [Actinobacillus pleuropneumoniae serovar 9 str. CVJ13261]
MTNQPNYHLIDQVRRRAEQFASKTALRYKSQQIWQDISWQSFQQSVDQFSLALLAHGIEVQQKIAIFAHNMPQ